MKILFTGGGTGGHFYPIIAIAEEVNKIIDEEKILHSALYYMSNEPYDMNALFNHGILFEKIPAARFSLLNIPTIINGMITALFKMYSIYPDVVVGKGGWASFPALFAARILGIPVLIHESDTIPGRVSRFAAKFAKRIAVSFEEAGTYFPEDKVAWTGQPVRSELRKPAKSGIYEYLKLDPTIPVIAILGGSQGAQTLNDVILSALPRLVERYQIIHQVGEKNELEVKTRADFILKDSPNRGRYRVFGFLNVLALKMVAGAAKMIISRSGSILFEIASWGVPSILVPLPTSYADHQLKNAFSYARAGGCIVIEEKNLNPNILVQQINGLMADEKKREEMSKAAQDFFKPDAAEKIAREVVRLALTHKSS